MKNCHVCNAVCEDNAEVCGVCGAFFENAVTEDAGNKVNEDYNPVLLATFDDAVSAEIFKDILADNGIRYSGDDTDGDSSLRILFGVGLVADDLFVDEKDFDRANELYNEFLENPPEFEEFDGEFEEEE